MRPAMLMLLLEPLLQLGDELANEKLNLKSAPYSQIRLAVESRLNWLLLLIGVDE
jgi:hypothetical protein